MNLLIQLAKLKIVTIYNHFFAFAFSFMYLSSSYPQLSYTYSRSQIYRIARHSTTLLCSTGEYVISFAIPTHDHSTSARNMEPHVRPLPPSGMGTFLRPIKYGLDRRAFSTEESAREGRFLDLCATFGSHARHRKQALDPIVLIERHNFRGRRHVYRLSCASPRDGHVKRTFS